MIKKIVFLSSLICVCSSLHPLAPESSVAEQEITLKHKLTYDLVFLMQLPKSFKAFQAMDSTERLRLQKLSKQTNAIPARHYSKNVSTAKQVVFEDLYQIYDRNIRKFNQFTNEPWIEVAFDEAILLAIEKERVQFLHKENEKESAEQRIKRQMLDQGLVDTEDHFSIKVNPSRGAQEGYVVTNTQTQQKYYVKTFTADARLGGTEGKIHPNEAFLYKVLEYLGMGPRAHFFIERGASSSGSGSIHRGNYIVTQDLDQEGSSIFLLDTENNQEHFGKIPQTKKLAIEIALASTVNDILAFADTFGDNPNNYGLLQSLSDSDTFSIQFVDHLPSPNGTFTNMRATQRKSEQYSPRSSLQLTDDSRLSPLMRFVLDSRETIPTLDIIKAVNERLFAPKEGGSSLVQWALQKAKGDIENLIRNYKFSFIPSAMVALEEYTSRISENIITYQETSSSS